MRDQLAATSGYNKLYVCQNYAHADEPLTTLYGYDPERLRKLVCLKERYDPKNVLSDYHSIHLL